MKRACAALFTCLLLSTFIGATIFTEVKEEILISKDTIETITDFFEAEANGFNIYDDEDRDITINFYQDMLSPYLNGEWETIVMRLVEDGATIAYPVTTIEINTYSMTNAIAGDQRFVTSRQYSTICRELPNASSKWYKAIINNFNYELQGVYTYNSNILDGIITSAATTLVIATPVESEVGLSYMDASGVSGYERLTYDRITGQHDAANIAPNGKSVQFSSSFYAIVSEFVSGFEIKVPFAPYYTVSR